MLLKKFEEFKANLILEYRYGIGNNTELMKNKEQLMEIVRNHPKTDEKEWGNEQGFTYDLRQPFFDMWQDTENKEILTRADMAYYALENYGILPTLALLLPGYIGQVNNGGHSQYLSNGYASSDRRDNDKDLHEILLEVWEESGFNKFSKSGRLSFEVAKDFDIQEQHQDCSYCDGSGQEEEEVEYEDDDGDTYTETEYETCGMCGGSGSEDSGYMEVKNKDELDSRLYKVNGRIDNDLERFLLMNYVD